MPVIVFFPLILLFTFPKIDTVANEDKSLKTAPKCGKSENGLLTHSSHEWSTRSIDLKTLPRHVNLSL